MGKNKQNRPIAEQTLCRENRIDLSYLITKMTYDFLENGIRSNIFSIL